MANRWIDAAGVQLTGLGLVGALGYDATTALAAARAGVSRASAQTHWRLRSGVTGLEEPVIGHAADLLTMGFEGSARLKRLASGALQDLASQGADSTGIGGRLGVYLALPRHDRVLGCGSLRSADASPPAPEDLPAPEPAGQFLQGLPGADAWLADTVATVLQQGGHTAGVSALQAAVQALLAGQIDTAIVLAVDSLLDEDSLSWLAACGRLKCDDMPSGLLPGEAAVALAFRRTGEAGRPLAALRGLALAEEPLAQAEARVSHGEVLCAVLAQARAADPQRSSAWLLADLNGEHHRAHEWGSALARLRGVDDGFAAPAVWLPALGFGDTFAASAPLAVAMACHAWQRGCAPAAGALVASCADDGARTALLLTAH